MKHHPASLAAILAVTVLAGTLSATANAESDRRQIPEKERVKTGVQQLFAIADKATQPEQPCAIHDYRTQKDRGRCSERRPKSLQCLNNPPGGGRRKGC